MNPQHQKILQFIDNDSKILDIACGTGALALKMAKHAKFVTGIDLSEEMIKVAKATQDKSLITNTNFMEKNATELNCFQDKEFDISTISMAIHQFPVEIAKQILKQLNRISKKIIILDYAFPLPKNLYKTIVYSIEWLAGKEHYANFSEYMTNNGIINILQDCSITIQSQKTTKTRIFTIVEYEN